MIVAVHQPHYLPWLRYMHKLASCDVFVVLDDTQYEKNGWQNRNQIKGPNGPILLTVPVQDASFKPINEVRINNQVAWAEKHWKSIQQAYGRARFFRQYASVFESGFARSWSHLADLNLHFLRELCGAFGVPATVVTSSSLGLSGRGTRRLVDICRRLGATHYLTGAYAAHNHLDHHLFAEAGIQVRVQTWGCPLYTQLYLAQGFVHDLSAVDLLMNEGPDALQVLLTQDRAIQAAVAMA